MIVVVLLYASNLFSYFIRDLVSNLKIFIIKKIVFEFLEKIRRQSPRVKKQIAFLVSFSLCGIIFVVWLSVIYPNFRSEQDQKAKVAEIEPSPISTFGATLETAISAMSAQFSKIKETMSTFSTSVEHYSATTTDTSMMASPIYSDSISTTTEQ